MAGPVSDHGNQNLVTTEQLQAALKQWSEWTVQLLVNEMSQRFGEVHQRLDRIELRLDRQGGLIQTGTRWISRQVEWS
jgi:hypothetical protein